jgi:excinuclease ABC subunit C
VGNVSQDEYQISVDNAIAFLSGKSAAVQKSLTEKMQQLSSWQNYEKAAFVRDQIKSLNAIQVKQNININQLNDADVITVVSNNGEACIYVTFFRGSRSLGSKPYFYEIEEGKNLAEFLSEFLGQFYLSQKPANIVLLNVELPEKDLMEAFLEKISDQKVKILKPQRGFKISLIEDQERLALQNLEQKVLQNLNNKQLLLEVKKLFDLPKIPQKIEVYDNSHTFGTNAVGALITAGAEGFIKSGYRKFNLRFDISKNRDDTAMMREVFTRRFSKLKKEEYPDLIIIDGGKPQMSAAQEIFSELKVSIPFVCISKGPNRNAGEENFHQIKKESFTLPKNSPVMHYLQRLRDEAHRFAIMTHRKKRDKAMAL